MKETSRIKTNYEKYLKDARDEEFIKMCNRNYNQVLREENLEGMLAKT